MVSLILPTWWRRVFTTLFMNVIAASWWLVKSVTLRNILEELVCRDMFLKEMEHPKGPNQLNGCSIWKSIEYVGSSDNICCMLYVYICLYMFVESYGENNATILDLVIRDRSMWNPRWGAVAWTNNLWESSWYRSWMTILWYRWRWIRFEYE